MSARLANNLKLRDQGDLISQVIFSVNLERWYHLDKLKWKEITDGKVQGNLGTMSHTVQLKHVVFKVSSPEKLRFTLQIT